MTESTSFDCEACEKEVFNWGNWIYNGIELTCPKCKTIYVVKLTKKIACHVEESQGEITALGPGGKRMRQRDVEGKKNPWL